MRATPLVLPPIRRLVFVLLWSLAALAANAHEMRPAYLQLHETTAGEFNVLWKTPMLGESRLALEPEFSGETTQLTAVSTRTPPGSAVQSWTLRAREIRGQQLHIRGLESTMTDALVRFEFADGTTWTQRLTARTPTATVPLRPAPLAVAGVYLKLGVEHILTGIDHLLFILALIIITRGGWNLVKTVTAFTVSHSLTLTGATLGLVHIPQRPVEAVIALSIVFVAAEILNEQKGRPGLTVRAPWIVALTFGLLHGFGFAGGLSEIGLPAGHIPIALLFFSIGVEVGQFLFIGSVLALFALARRSAARVWAHSTEQDASSHIPNAASCLRLIPPYAIGAVAMFWVIQRVAAF